MLSPPCRTTAPAPASALVLRRRQGWLGCAGLRSMWQGRHPAQPWCTDELERVVAAMEDLCATLTPSPLPNSIVGTASDMFAIEICGWRQMLDDRQSFFHRLDEWSRRHLETLATIEETAADALIGNTLLHMDIRADNILLTPERVWFLDWPHACNRPFVAGRRRLRPQRDDAGRASPGGGYLKTIRVPRCRKRFNNVGSGVHSGILHSPSLAAAPTRPAHRPRIPGSPGCGRKTMGRPTHRPLLAFCKQLWRPLYQPPTVPINLFPPSPNVILSGAKRSRRISFLLHAWPNKR